MKNMNITVDLDNNLIGFTGGISQTIQLTNYSGRVAILMTVFVLIAIAGLAINFSINRAHQQHKEK